MVFCEVEWKIFELVTRTLTSFCVTRFCNSTSKLENSEPYDLDVKVTFLIKQGSDTNFEMISFFVFGLIFVVFLAWLFFRFILENVPVPQSTILTIMMMRRRKCFCGMGNWSKCLLCLNTASDLRTESEVILRFS